MNDRSKEGGLLTDINKERKPSGSESCSFSYSSSYDSSDKDSLFDEMQEKIADLLKVNQLLFEEKKKNDFLKNEMQRKYTQYQHDKEGLNNIIQENAVKQQELEQKITKFEEQLVKLQAENDDLKNFVDNVSKEHSASEEDLKNQMNSQINEYSGALAKRDQHIKNLETELLEYKGMYDTAQKSLIEQSRNNEKLQSKNTILEGQLDQSIAQIEQLKSAVDNRKIKQKALNSEVKQLKEQLKQFQNDNNLLVEEKSQLMEEKLELQTHLEKIKEQNLQMDQAIQQISSQFSSSKNIALQVKSLKACNKELQDEINEKQIIIAKLEADLSTCMNDMKETHYMLEQQIQTFENLKQTHQIEHDINLRQMQKIKSLQMREKVFKSIDKANKEYAKKINYLRSAITNKPEQPTFRSLIISAMMCHRWIGLVWTEKQFTHDNRNWWWLTPNEDDNDKLIEKVDNLLEDCLAQQEENVSLKEKINESLLIIQQNKTHEEEQEKQISKYKQKIHELEKTVDDQANIINVQVEPLRYQKLITKYNSLKNVLKQQRQAAKDLDQTNTSLKKLIEKETKRANKATYEYQVTAKELAKYKLRYDATKESVDLYEKQLNGQNQEILTLERLLSQEKQRTHTMAFQCSSMAVENRMLNNRRHEDNMSIPDKDEVTEVIMKHRMLEMSRNLSGTKL